MSAKTIYTCDHCNKPVEFGQRTLYLATFNYAVYDMPDLHACSKTHMGLALAKAFGLPMDNNALRLVTEKNDALDAARAAIIECDNMRARLSKLEAQNHHAGELLAKAQARVAELEQAWDMLKKSLDESDLQRNEGLAKIADLEKRLAEATEPPRITIPTKPTKPLVAFTEVELAKIDEYHQRQPRCPLWTYLEMSVELFDEKRAAGQLDFAQRRIRA